MNKKNYSWRKWVIISIITSIFIFIGYIGYTTYNRQNEEKNKLLQEISSLKSEVEKLNNETEETKINVSDLSEQNEKASQIIKEQNNQIGKEKVCRQANDLLSEIKQACDIKPFPGVNECIEEMEGKLDYLGEENYKKYHMDDKVNNLKELKSRYLLLKNQCDE